jgi:hypothetical protein
MSLKKRGDREAREFQLKTCPGFFPELVRAEAEYRSGACCAAELAQYPSFRALRPRSAFLNQCDYASVRSI